MSSYYSSPPYEPISPSWSSRGSSSSHHHDVQPRAPVMPYTALPAVDDDVPYAPSSPHYGLLTPPPSSDSGINPLLCARPTVVRYDFASHPRTIRLSSSVGMYTFPTTHPASIPSHAAVYIECEASGQVVPIRNDRSTHGITCADVLVQLHAYFDQPLSPDELRRMPGPQRSSVKAAFARRSAQHRDSTMRMVDCLQGQTAFKCLKQIRGGRSGTPRWLLQTTA